MAAALFPALLTIPGPGHAQSIVNTARATWVQGGETRSVSSNTVATAIERQRLAIDLFHPALGAAPLVMTPSHCGGQPLPTIPTADGGTISLPAAATDAVRMGEILVVKVSAPLANRDPSAADSLMVTLTGASGDREKLTIFETGENTGVFAGAIRTASIPVVPIRDDCRLSVRAGDTIQASLAGADGSEPIVSQIVNVLADPFGVVFDSVDGTPVSGARVVIVDAATGAPAPVFAEDGATPWPSAITSGEPVTDSGGNSYSMAPGEYRFPLMPFGRYRILVTPPAPYSAPSTAPTEALAALTRPGGGAFQIGDASYGRPFDLATPEAIRVDVPVDRPALGVTLTKSVSRAQAQPGDSVLYTVNITNPDPGHAQRNTILFDHPSPWLRVRAGSLRIDGRPAPAALTRALDGRSFTIDPGPILPGATVRVTYAMTVDGGAPPGQALNRIEARDAGGRRAVAEAALRVTRDSIAARMTVIGRVVLGTCAPTESGIGIPGVRIMLEDGSFAITDRDGRYHFEGVEPGTHVVALAPQTLPPGAEAIDCERSTRSAGSAISRFVTGQGGSLAVADFNAALPGAPPSAPPAPARGSDGPSARPAPPSPVADPLIIASDRAASGAETDWLALGDGPADFLFPAAGHNPRIPSTRAVIRHRPGQTVALKVNGRAVDPLAFEGTRSAPGGGWAVSIWRGIPLGQSKSVLAATITNADGAVAQELVREIQFVSAPWHAELIPARSQLIADGRTRPVAAVRFTDREGRPVRSGVTGSFAVSEPYESAALLDQLQLGQLTGAPAGLPGGGAIWTIEGDDGVALIELAPTMVSGPLHLDFAFADQSLTRQQQIEAWVVPGDLPFTLVGIAEGTLGAKSIADQMDRSHRFDSDLGDDARVAFYAKGRVPGRMLLTVAYDSAKEEAGQRLLGSIDPAAYYTIYADGSTRRFDAASTEKLYVRLEAQSFYALYGDFVTGFDQTRLARYQRTLTGLKAETRVGAVHAQGFAARVAGRYRRDEIQGAGITGPYALGSRDLLANSEKVAIEVRDRLRSEVIVSRRELIRFVDYDIDPLAATIRFREPVLSRDFDLNPQFIVIDYETLGGDGEAEWNAGLRADVTLGARDPIRIGATAISDRGEGPRTGIAGVDLRARIGDATELRAEAALSRGGGEDSTAWLVEAEHRSGKLDVLGYARQTDREFGVGQQNGVELGRRKFGVDARLQLGDNASLVARSWHDESLTDTGRRLGVQGDYVWRGAEGDARIGIAHLTDKLPDGRSASSTMLDGQATRRLMGNRLEIGVGTSVALGSDAAVDLPARHRVRARYALSDAVRVVGNYEIAKGEEIDARTFNLGLELSPWAGARIVSTIGRQDIAEAGARSYAAFGLAQSVTLSPTLTLDATVDGNRELGGADVFDLVNPQHPASSGGHLSQDGALFEDFTALTLGLGWRIESWSATLRGEWRDGEYANRKGLTGGVIRQLGDGVTVGGGASWTRAAGSGAAATEVIDAAIAAAYRPAGSELAGLAKLEFRSDRVSDAVLGQTGPAGRTALTVDGDAKSQRLIASVSTSWRPVDENAGKSVRRSEIGLFAGARYNLDRLERQEIAGTALLAGVDARLGIGERIEVGGSGTLRANVTEGTTAFAIGPQIGISPAKNTLLTVGYNIKGFRDADFAEARHTGRGLYASVKLKLDRDSLGFLGLGRR
ncbi:carboxypeptidase-like regulatory domain-containing protein [Qipengyuania sediminis]|uniref:carboxypeptidase-like regulatory domain-containing protein n=1 Tax=Qipengyuania sediminis TaxID=1532023 RepID=UPI00105975CF|nr:carboxypeptidase-like regulatory domain-containing protein [Qipengyuania sediminis]